MNYQHQLLKAFSAVGLILAMGASMNANAGFFGFGGSSWKEEALQPDGTKVVVERSVSRKGRHEIGQRSAIGDQSLAFTLPGTGQRIKWEDTYTEDVGNGNFSPLLLGVSQGKAYVVASPTGCLSYNKWGRPNPPYLVFRHEGSEWKRIALGDLPAEFKRPNLIISSPDDEVEKSGTRLVTAEMVGRINGLDEPWRGVPLQYKSILREAYNGAGGSCEELILYKGHWIMPNSPIARDVVDRKTKTQLQPNQ